MLDDSTTMLKLIVFTLLGLQLIDTKGLPSYLKLCHRRDPNIHSCVKENIEILRPKFKKGIPELFIPSLNPLVISQATLNSGNQFTAAFRDIELYNADSFDLQGFDIDLDKYLINIKIAFPVLRIKSNYNIKGRILILNLDGRGPADGNYTNVDASMYLKGTPFHKKGKEFVKWEPTKTDIKIQKISIVFDKLFGENEELNSQTNRIINQNIDSIIEELQPVIQKVVAEVVFGVVNRLFNRYPITELFPN